MNRSRLRKIEELINIPSRGSISPDSNEPITPPSINDEDRMKILGEITPIPNCTIIQKIKI